MSVPFIVEEKPPDTGEVDTLAVSPISSKVYTHNLHHGIEVIWAN